MTTLLIRGVLMVILMPHRSGAGKRLLHKVERVGVVNIESVEVISTCRNAVTERLAVFGELQTKKVGVDALAPRVILRPKLDDRVDVAARINAIVVLSQRRLIVVEHQGAFVV